MPDLTAAETVRAADAIVHDIGSKWMLDPAVSERGKELGFGNPFAFYFAGRGGVLGDVDGSVVWAALGFFEPGVVRAMGRRRRGRRGPGGGAPVREGVHGLGRGARAR